VELKFLKSTNRSRVAFWSKNTVSVALAIAAGLSFGNFLRSHNPNFLNKLSEPTEFKARAGKFTATQGSMRPIIPLGYQQISSVPFLNEVMRDNDLLKHRPEDDSDATRLVLEIKEMRSDLSRAQGERAAELNEQVYQGYVALAYYFEDVTTGVLTNNVTTASAASNLKSVRTLMMRHALAFSKQTKNQAAKARALYHVNATLFVTGQSKGRAVENLRALQKQKLSNALSRRAAVLISMYEVERGQNKSKAMASMQVVRGSLPSKGAVAIDLFLAKAKVTGGVDKSYRSHLSRASQKVAGLSSTQKEAVFNFSVAIWRRAERNTWSNAPFNMKNYAELGGAKAVTERRALEDWREGRKNAAIRKYQDLSHLLTGTPTKAMIDLRILDMKKAEYLVSKNPKPYETALLAANSAYLDPGILGDNADAQVKSTAQEISRRYKSLVYDELGRVALPAVQKSVRLRAVSLANKYLTTVEDANEIESVKSKIAGLYVLNNDHRHAVALYKELSETNNSVSAKRYVTLAIVSQSVLAKWPTKVPWNGSLSATNPQDREDLLTFYRKLSDMNPKQVDWFILGQSGLLEINLGRPEAAFTAWTAGLKQSRPGTQDVNMNNAAGFMLVAYQSSGDWNKLEALSRFCLKSRIAALRHNKSIDVTNMLALALLEGGKQALEAQNFVVAVKKLREFVKKHPQAANHDQGFFLLASAYRGNGQHTDSIKTLIAFVERYPRSTYYRQALLNGGDWSAPLAFEDNAIFFYARFANEYSKDEEAVRVRDTLKDVYLGRGFYAEASGILEAQSKAPSLDGAARMQALAMVMDIEERQGSMARALLAADKILVSSEADDNAKAEALSLKARQLAAKNQLADLQRLEAQLAASGASSFAMQDALGEIRYILAIGQSKNVVKAYFNQSLKDPMGIINQRYQSFKTASNAFKNVCSTGPTSYCAPAMHRLARLSEEFLQSLEDITVQDTLAKEVVNGFQNRKQAILNEVARTSQSADDRSLAVLSEGNTSPDWTQAVLWHNSSDVNFERVTGEAGNGYLQWGE
jgi:outer membrane protein assembly factor BamD (BamD/ComL family)